MSLSDSERNQFEHDGFVCPLTVFSPPRANELRRQLEALERQVANDNQRTAAFRNDANWVIPLFDSLAREPAILDSVEAVLGADILALHVDVFIKDAGSAKFISWHQDLHYWGLDADNEVTAWLALSPATVASGCMRFIPGSHKKSYEHKDTFADDNMLTRGQAAQGVPEKDAVNAVLAPGQMSLHHGNLLHASGPNTSADRRIGIAIRYVSPEMKLAQQGDKMGASLVRGVDRYGHFDLVEPPSTEFDADDLRNWQRLHDIEEAILFANADQTALAQRGA